MNSTQVACVFGVGDNERASDFFLIQHIYSETEIVSSRKTLQGRKKTKHLTI